MRLGSTSAVGSLDIEMLLRFREQSGTQVNLFATEVVSRRSATNYKDYHPPGLWNRDSML